MKKRYWVMRTVVSFATPWDDLSMLLNTRLCHLHNSGKISSADVASDRFGPQVVLPKPFRRQSRGRRRSWYGFMCLVVRCSRFSFWFFRLILRCGS